jgi:hypothetical protein
VASSACSTGTDKRTAPADIPSTACEVYPCSLSLSCSLSLLHVMKGIQCQQSSQTIAALSTLWRHLSDLASFKLRPKLVCIVASNWSRSNRSSKRVPTTAKIINVTHQGLPTGPRNLDSNRPPLAVAGHIHKMPRGAGPVSQLLQCSTLSECTAG